MIRYTLVIDPKLYAFNFKFSSWKHLNCAFENLVGIGCALKNNFAVFEVMMTKWN